MGVSQRFRWTTLPHHVRLSSKVHRVTVEEPGEHVTQGDQKQQCSRHLTVFDQAKRTSPKSEGTGKMEAPSVNMNPNMFCDPCDKAKLPFFRRLKPAQPFACWCLNCRRKQAWHWGR